MAGSAQMGMAEPHDCRVRITVSGAVGVHFLLVHARHIVRDRVSIRAQLNHPEGNASPRECVAHSVSAYERIDP